MLATSTTEGPTTGNGTHPCSRPLRKENAGRTHRAGLVADRRRAACNTATSTCGRIDRTAHTIFIAGRHIEPSIHKVIFIASAKKFKCYSSGSSPITAMSSLMPGFS